jgi:hypothetical protein
MRVVIDPAFALATAVDFLIENDALPAAQRLLDRALVELPELLAQFPRIGREFLARNPETAPVAAAQEQAARLLGTDIKLREYLLGDYLVLYAIRARTVYLLTLRHHRQSAFPLSGG